MDTFWQIIIGLLTIYVLGFGVRPLLRYAQRRAPLPAPNEALKEKWTTLTSGDEGGKVLGDEGGKVLGQLERLAFFGAFWTGGSAQTIIRGNVFAKSSNSSGGELARPNVLLGHFPLEGPGSGDAYLLEGNVFYGNPTQSLLQAEGNVSVEGNLFLNPTGNGIAIQPHNDVQRRITIRDNFIATKGFGLRMLGAHPSYAQVVEGNEMYSEMSWPSGETRASAYPMHGSAAAALSAWLEGARSAKRSATLRALAAACRSR